MKEAISVSRNNEDYIAHISQTDKRIQTVPEHLAAVQEGCEVFGSKIGATHLAGMAGLLHDMGKNTHSFMQYIQLASADPENAPKRGSVDHSTAGGKWIYQRYHEKALLPQDKIAAEWIANCVISHHQGLRDYVAPEGKSPFLERVVNKKEGMEEYEQAVAAFLSDWTVEELDCYFADAKQELKRMIELRKVNKLRPIAFSLLIKYLFSCLIDADRTNTREFEENRYEGWERDPRPFFARSYEKVIQHLKDKNDAPDADRPINKLRRDMSQQCEDFAAKPSGIYTLSIPTGGGKTLASLRYALKHAMEYKKERIIYIVPYTTIIEQNAGDIRKILDDDDNILEHHSNVVDHFDPTAKDTDYDIQKERLSLARDNWDRPLIFTTMVQFLNTFYAKGTRNTRRLHRLSNSVIIFDEVQSIPPKCVSLFNAALNFLQAYGNSSLILCTATQPALDYVKNNLKISEQAEIIRDREEVSKAFKRVDLQPNLTQSGWRTEELADFIRQRMQDPVEEVSSVLVILNTKSAVRKLFNALEKEEWVQGGHIGLHHLSTSMCAAHRKTVLKEVQKALDPKTRKPIICISTQLIEAGVNVSFQCVIRSLAGLDSIAQAAGRCNRHGEDERRQVYIIRSAEENLTRLKEIKTGADITERLIREMTEDQDRYEEDLLSPQAMRQYFEYYFHAIKEDLNYHINDLKKDMYDLLDQNEAYYQEYHRTHGAKPDLAHVPSFATAEDYFEVIANNTMSVLVPYDDKANELLLDLNGELKPDRLSELLRESQQYVVNLYENERRILDREGDLYPLLHGNVWALRNRAYSPKFGVDVQSDEEGGWGYAGA